MHFMNYRVYNKDIKEHEILDYSCDGNIIRFYLGKNGNQWGDDWNDPIDSAGIVYEKYVGAMVDMYVPYDYAVLNPRDVSYNYYSSYSKEQMLHRCFPCVVIVPPEMIEHYYDLTFDKCQGCASAMKFYCGDDLSRYCEQAFPGTDKPMFDLETLTAADIGNREIIDVRCKGNVVHFYLGKNGTQTGEDWDHADYDEYAGLVRDEYIQATVDMYAPFGSYVLEPSDEWNHYGYGCGYTKNDMVKREVPCLIYVPHEVLINSDCSYEFKNFVDNPNVRKFYFGDCLN